MHTCLIGLIAMLLSVGIARAAQVPVADPALGDGGVATFYTWAGDIPEAPGKMLRTEPLNPVLGLSGAAEQFRILYTSTDGAGDRTPVVVSGAYFVPKGTAPARGWPLLAWAHGTTGLADVCAPSWTRRSQRDAAYLNAWLAQGFAIVATDYQGLGTPGFHPYPVVRSHAYSVLDSIRAVLKGFPGIANRIVVVGQSQGGSATFAALGEASGYAPELQILGGVATGVPYRAATVRPEPGSPAQPSDQADRTVAYSLYTAIVLLKIDPALTPDKLISGRGLPLLETARTTCVGQMFRLATGAGLNRGNTLTPGFFSAAIDHLPLFKFSTVRLPVPIFIGSGDQDRDAAPSRQLALVRDACAAGSVVEAHLYAGLDHSATVNASLKDSVPFVRKLIAGEAISPVCKPTPE
jgi:acetyl esterase/lipase